MPEILTYEIVSKNILKDSISSALFIDDKALEGFKSKNYSPSFIVDHNRTLQLYQDFKLKNCLLHSFKFTKSGWRKDKEFYLKNKDLLILDWQLVNTEHTEALKILDEAVKRKSLHFTCIYTQEAIDSVKRELNRFFWGNVSSEVIEEYREQFAGSELDEFWIIDKNDTDWRELESFLDNVINANLASLSNEIETFITQYNLSEELAASILELDSNSAKASYEKLKTILGLTDPNLIYSSFKESKYYSQSNENNITLYINHTVVKIFRKPEVSADVLYETFLNSFLSSEQNVFFSLMGLEIRNRFRDNSAFIGKDFDNLSEDAFFFHKRQNENTPEIFTEFLRELMKDQVSSFIYEDDLLLFNVLDEYYDSIDGGKRQSTFTHPSNKLNFKSDLFQLNYFYNRINLNKRKSNDALRFGDILSYTFNEIIDGQEVSKTKYFVCITAHCDCLRPKDKIKNQFWFIEGKVEPTQDSVLKGTDGKFVSFIKANNVVIAIDWRNGKKFCQPFTMLVDNNRFNENHQLNSKYYGEDITLNLVASLKDNYAQRLANEASGYPLRVGIDFVKK